VPWRSVRSTRTSVQDERPAPRLPGVDTPGARP
jgi:hypothetical protein